MLNGLSGTPEWEGVVQGVHGDNVALMRAVVVDESLNSGGPFLPGEDPVSASAPKGPVVAPLPPHDAEMYSSEGTLERTIYSAVVLTLQ